LFKAIEHFAKFPDKVFLTLSNVARRRLGKIDCLVFRHFTVDSS